jgi:hypothetical protein
MPRVVPAVTATWVNDLSMSRLGVPMQTVPDGEGSGGGSRFMMSDNRLAQLVATKPVDGKLQVGLLVWNLPRGTQIATLMIENIKDANIVLPEIMRVPSEIKRDIEYSGYPRPPQEVLWVSAEIPAPAQDQPLTMDLRVTANGKPIEDTLSVTLQRSPTRTTKPSS